MLFLKLSTLPVFVFSSRMQRALIPDILFSNSYMDERRITVMTFPLISFRVTGPNSRLSFPPERISDIRKYSFSFRVIGYFTASVSYRSVS